MRWNCAFGTLGGDVCFPFGATVNTVPASIDQLIRGRRGKVRVKAGASLRTTKGGLHKATQMLRS